MTDIEYILLVIAAFYLYESAYFVRSGGLLFRSQLGERPRMQTLYSAALLRNQWGGLLFGNLLPFGNSIPCQCWPVSLSVNGICSYVSQAITPDGLPDQSGRFVRYADIRSVCTESRAVLVNGSLLANVCSNEFAAFLVSCISRLASLSASDRAAEIENILEKVLDANEVRDHYRNVVRHSVGLLISCTGLFLYIFVLFPILIWSETPIAFIPAAILYLGLLALVMWNYHCAAEAILPSTEKPKRHLMLMLLSPAEAMQARNRLFRSVFSKYHPLTLAYALCSSERFLEFAGTMWRDLRYPLLQECPVDNLEARDTTAWFQSRLEVMVETFIKRAGVDPELLNVPPMPEASECQSYCPRCHGQYVQPAKTCSICTGVPLRAFNQHLSLGGR